MPTPAISLLLCAGALTAALLLSVAGPGIAFAEPDSSSNSGETGGSGVTGPVSEPAPPIATPNEPKGLLGALQDFLPRPRSVFGDGRVPGQPPTTILTAQGHPQSGATTQDEPKAASAEESTKPGPAPVEESIKPDPKPDPGPVGQPTKPDPGPVEEPTKPAPPVEEPPTKPEPPGKPDPTGEHAGKPDPGPPDPPAPVKKSTGSLASLVLPGAFTFSVPIPTFPGTADLNWTWDLSSPCTALTSYGDNVARLGALVQDIAASFNPFPKPPPKPTLRILEEEPVVVVEASGGNDPHHGVGAPDLPVLRAPMALPAPRMGPPRPLTDLVHAGASGASSPHVLGVGTAGVQGPTIRGSVTQGSVQAAEPGPAATPSPLGNNAFRHGYSQYLRTARVGELATVALPGIAGLLALTASGGVIGYRQANSGRYVRADAGRFLR